jgi:hypothetical protein
MRDLLAEIRSTGSYWRSVAYRDLASNPAGKEKSPTEDRLGIRNRTEYIFHTFVEPLLL